MAQSREAKLEKMRVAQRERYHRQKLEDPDSLRAAKREAKRRMQIRGVPSGAYKRYLGLDLKGPPTKAQRAELYRILDLQPLSGWKKVAAARPRFARPRAQQPSIIPPKLYMPTVPDPPAPPGADPYLVARLLHDTAECECRICSEMRFAAYFQKVV